VSRVLRVAGEPSGHDENSGISVIIATATCGCAKLVEEMQKKKLLLDERESDELRARVLRRDGWSCQFCGSMTNL